MKILHLHDKPRFQGGVERILYDMAAGLSEFGEQGLLFCIGGSEQRFFAPFSWQGMSLKDAMREFDPDVAIVHKVSDHDLIESVSRQLPTIIFVHDHDMTCPRRHKYFPGSDIPCNLAAGSSCLKNLCFIEAAPIGSHIPIRLFKGISRQQRLIHSSQKANAFIVGSRAMQQELSINGIDNKRIHIIPPIPSGLESTSPLPMSQDPNLLFVGQLVRGKGVDLLLKAIKNVELDYTLTIVGEGNHRTECEELCEKLGLNCRVNFVGWVDYGALSKYYLKCQIAVVPSRWPEPFGMVGIEAMARGRPVVAFENGGISDWLINGVTGLLVSPGNTNEFAEKVQLLLQYRHLRNFMSINAHKMVQQQYKHSIFIKQMLAATKEVVHENDNFCMRG